jgi:23S rRNA (uracil1939-C5)-methyltransferase
VVYVSCAPDTLARDVALLAKSGFQAVRSRVLDMFPRTAEFESVTVLEKAIT